MSIPADNTGMETLQRAAVAVRNLIASDPEHNAWADWVPVYLDRLSQEEPACRCKNADACPECAS